MRRAIHALVPRAATQHHCQHAAAAAKATRSDGAVAAVAVCGCHHAAMRWQSSSTAGGGGGGMYAHGGVGVPPELRAPAQSGQRASLAREQQQQQQQMRMRDGGDGDNDDAAATPPRPQKPTTPPRHIKIHTDERAVATLQLARAPVNSLHLDMLQEMNAWLLWLGSNEETRALVLTSAIPTVFSAGLDLTELSLQSPPQQQQQTAAAGNNGTPEQQQQQRFAAFWQAFQETWLILNTFPKPIVGAITGNCPAGGCTLAMGCDYRIMARGPRGSSNNSNTSGGAHAQQRLYRIGLNETKLGIPPPAWTMPAYAYLLGSRRAERMLQLGETPTADEAAAIGLVDQVEDDEEATLRAAQQCVDRFLAIPQQARWMARDMMRREYLQMLSSDEDRNYDTEFTTQLMGSAEVQQSLASYLDRLKGKMRR